MKEKTSFDQSLNEEGLTCTDCRLNLKNFSLVIQGHHYDDKTNWIAEWQLKSDYGINAITIRKLERQGEIKRVQFKAGGKENGIVYFTLYLKEENKDFFKKHQKIRDKAKFKTTGLRGEELEF